MTIFASEAWYPRIPICVVCNLPPMFFLILKKSMEDIDDLLELAKDCADMKGHDLFNVALISNLEDFAKYKKEREEKEKVLGELRRNYIELERVNGPMQIVSEPFTTCRRRLSLEDIVEYAEGLDNSDDVKTIQIMLFRLLAKHCSAEELDMIGNIRTKKHAEVTNVFHDHSQYVGTVKKQNINHGRNNNV